MECILKRVRPERDFRRRVRDAWRSLTIESAQRKHNRTHTRTHTVKHGAFFVREHKGGEGGLLRVAGERDAVCMGERGSGEEGQVTARFGYAVQSLQASKHVGQAIPGKQKFETMGGRGQSGWSLVGYRSSSVLSAKCGRVSACACVRCTLAHTIQA